MKTLKYKIKDLAEAMYHDARNEKYVVAVLFYDEAIRLMGELITYDYVTPEAFQIAPPDWDGYCKEYYVSLVGDGMCLSIEKAYEYNDIYRKSMYFISEGDVLYVDENASEEVYKYAFGDKVYKVEIADDDFIEHLCDNKCSYDGFYESEDDDKLDKLLDTAVVKKMKDGKPIEVELDFDAFLDYLFG